MRDMAEELGIPVKGLDGPATPNQAKAEKKRAPGKSMPSARKT